MKAIILAAGQGNRLRPLTDCKPKCMVEFKGRPLIDYILSTMSECGINDIIIVNGYKKEILLEYLTGRKIKYYENKRFAVTNMVTTLFCAEKEMNEDIIISYSDIIYTKEVLQRLVENKDAVAVTVDKDWRRLWDIRNLDPLLDAETMKIDNEGYIVELGKKPKDCSAINGQYMGLIKISKESVDKIVKFYKSLDRKVLYDGKPFELMYMTSFIQSVIDELMPVKAVLVYSGWLEVDSYRDLEQYEKISSDNYLGIK